MTDKSANTIYHRFCTTEPMSLMNRSRFTVIAFLLLLPMIAFGAPAIPTATSPLTEASTATPQFAWQHEPDALKYVLMVVDRSTGVQVHWKHHHANDICTDMQCSFTPDINLGFSNQHIWYVRSWNSTGASSWAKTVFAYKDALPKIPTPIAPLVSIESSQPDFSWTHQENAVRYVLVVVDRSTSERVHWDSHLADDICSPTQCSSTPDINLGFSNQHVWFVRSWNLTGASAWAKSVFAYQDVPPSVPEALWPVETIDWLETEFEWSRASNATSYVVLIHDVTNNNQLHWKVYSSDEVCSGVFCALDPSIDLEYNTQYVWYVRSRHSTGSSAWARTDFTTLEDDTPKSFNPADITDLILVTGQSNVRGSQTVYDSTLDAISLKVFAYTSADDWEIADLHQAWDVDGWHPGNGSLEPHCLADPQCVPRQPYNNFAFHFAKTVVTQDPDRVVGIIVAAAPGKGISHWNQNSDFSQTIQSKVVAALNAQGVKAQLDGILWHQGETDWQIDGTSDPEASDLEKSLPGYYPNKLNNLINRFRAESWFGSDKPFICGETKQAPVNQRLMALDTDNDPWTGCVEAADLATREMDLNTTPPELGTHFNDSGLRTLGERYGRKYLEMTSP